MSQPLLTGNQVSKKRELDTSCILCDQECNEECKSNLSAWSNLEEKSKNWIGLDTFGDVFDRVDWRNGPQGMYLHSNCKIKLFNSRSLEQAKRRKEKECSRQSMSNDNNGEKSLDLQKSPENTNTVARRSSIGTVHSKNLCIWCMEPEDTRHKGRKNSKLHLINQVGIIYLAK